MIVCSVQQSKSNRQRYHHHHRHHYRRHYLRPNGLFQTSLGWPVPPSPPLSEKNLWGQNGKAKITRHRASTSNRWYFAFGLCCHSNETRAPIANPPNSAQLEGTRYRSPKLHPVRTVVWEWCEQQTDTQADARDQYAFRFVYNSREM